MRDSGIRRTAAPTPFPRNPPKPPTHHPSATTARHIAHLEVRVRDAEGQVLQESHVRGVQREGGEAGPSAARHQPRAQRQAGGQSHSGGSQRGEAVVRLNRDGEGEDSADVDYRTTAQQGERDGLQIQVV